MRKKLLSVLLSFAMLLSLLPVTALAADEPLPEAKEGVITISQPGTYTIESGEGITDRIEVSAEDVILVVDGSVTVAGAESPAIAITNKGSLTIQGSGMITGGSYGIEVQGGELTVKGGTITGTSAGIYVSQSDTEITVTIGEEKADNSSISISGANALYFDTGSEAVKAYVKSGTFKSTGEDGESVKVNGSGPSKFISGGVFSTSVDLKYLADGLKYEAKAVSGEAPDSYGYSYHKTLTDAMEAAGENGTVVNTNESQIYTVTFDLNYEGATNTLGPAYVCDGEAAYWPADPTRDVHAFDAWYTAKEGGDKVDAAYQFTEDTTVYAHWVYAITFDANGGKINGKPTATVNTDEDGKLEESKVPKPDDRKGYAFDGWYTVDEDAELVEFPHTFTENTRLSAHWTRDENSPIYTITFDANGGTFAGIGGTTTADTDEYGILKDTDLPAKPTRSGYTFDAWYESKEGEDKVDFTYAFTADATVYAHWTKNADPTYTITFDANGGTFADGKTMTATTNGEGKLDSLPDAPTRDGYLFDDWHTAKEGGDQVSTAYQFTKDTTVYAHWKEDPGSDDPGNDDPGSDDPDSTESIYSIRISDTRHGSISTSHTSAKAGTIVTLTVIPETDYIVDEIEITSAKGSSPRLDRSGRLYTFTMPASSVTVNATFALQAMYNTFVPPQSQSQSQTQTNTHGALSASAFKPITSRSAVTMQDVPANSWAYPAAQWAYQNGYLDTTADGSFRLNDTVSHLQLWKIMAQWLGEPSLDTNSVNRWARKSGASRIGTSSGVMTRQNMVEYLYQCYFLMGGDVSVTGNLIQYRDGQQIMSGSAKNAWLWAVNKGIINGTGEGYLNPNGVLSRAEFASILMRLCQNG